MGFDQERGEGVVALGEKEGGMLTWRRRRGYFAQ